MEGEVPRHARGRMVAHEMADREIVASSTAAGRSATGRLPVDPPVRAVAAADRLNRAAPDAAARPVPAAVDHRAASNDRAALTERDDAVDSASVAGSVAQAGARSGNRTGQAPPESRGPAPTGVNGRQATRGTGGAPASAAPPTKANAARVGSSARAAEESGREDDEDDDNRPYCLCRKPSYGEMIGCDNENCQYEWFHLACVGLQPGFSTRFKGKWFCPSCQPLKAAAGNGSAPGAVPGTIPTAAGQPVAAAATQGNGRSAPVSGATTAPGNGAAAPLAGAKRPFSAIAAETAAPPPRANPPQPLASPVPGGAAVTAPQAAPATAADVLGGTPAPTQ